MRGAMDKTVSRKSGSSHVKSLAAEIEAVMKKHIKCDATGLAPAVASVYLTGFSEAAAEVADRLAGERIRPPIGRDDLREAIRDEACDFLAGGGSNAEALDDFADKLLAGPISHLVAENRRLNEALEAEKASDEESLRLYRLERDRATTFRAEWSNAAARASRLEAEIAANQSRAFEDGARKRLSDALAAYDAAERELTAAEAVHQDVCRRMGDEPDIGEIMQRVGAEQACMRCSMAKGIARADLVSTVRAALQPEGERSDA